MESKKQQQAAHGVPIDRAYPNPNPNPNLHVHYSGISSTGGNVNPYVQVAPVPASKEKNSMGTFLKLLGRCGKKLEEETRKATETTGNVWNHLKTSPNVCDAAMARIAHETKAFAEGGNDKIFQQTFGVLPAEQLRKTFACYISTSSGPVIGTLYVSTRRLAFCSDNHVCHYSANGQPEWVYYKVVVQLDQLRAVNPSANIRNPTDRYIQIITADGHEFWFMGFVSYDKAFKSLTETLHHYRL
ncbi:uncharacterized protein A4U43_C07F10160 [Asparagus officinalis]|uniref:GRAM domain-containing protein n=1 Tax=Asparagus officinalis TaxID=4686 RepID=A0A5P1EE34_ASPOF|nr:GLABRA2 expression modulator-like [Asparagus officinalis]ONK62981.1 uncharacterized protein A4U43_C07F10160 [Asparagus officinalis]